MTETFANSQDGDGRQTFTIDSPTSSVSVKVDIPNPVIADQPIDTHLTFTYKKDIKFKGSRVVPDNLTTQDGRHKLKKNATVDQVFGKSKPMMFQLGYDSAINIPWSGASKIRNYTKFEMSSQKIFVKPGQSVTVDKMLNPLDCEMIEEKNFPYQGVIVNDCAPSRLDLDVFAQITGRDKNMSPKMPAGTSIQRSLKYQLSIGAMGPMRPAHPVETPALTPQPTETPQSTPAPALSPTPTPTPQP